MIPHNFSEDQRQAYMRGADDARAFNFGSHLIHQDVFKAESAEWKLHISYDDVEYGVELSVTFKHRYDSAGMLKTVRIPCGTAAKAIRRAVRFIAANPLEEPTCTVDY